MKIHQRSIHLLLVRTYFGWPSLAAVVPFVALHFALGGALYREAPLSKLVPLPWLYRWNEYTLLAASLVVLWPFQFVGLYRFAKASEMRSVFLRAALDSRRRGNELPTATRWMVFICLMAFLQAFSAVLILDVKGEHRFVEAVWIWFCFESAGLGTLAGLIDYKLTREGRMRI